MSDLTRAVDVLGACVDARAVADLLVAAGARGARHSLGNCPLAVYLRRRVDYRQVRVTGNDAVGYDRGSKEIERVALPDAVRWFVASFDAGVFPELRHSSTYAPSVT